MDGESVKVWGRLPRALLGCITGPFRGLVGTWNDAHKTPGWKLDRKLMVVGGQGAHLRRWSWVKGSTGAKL